MAQRIIMTDGAKAISVNPAADREGVWTYFMGAPQEKKREYYAAVSAAFRAVNRSAMVIASLPFALVDKSGEDYDVSNAWENKAGVWPHPKDHIRRLDMSITMGNEAYLRVGVNQFERAKQLHFVMKKSINILTDSVTGDLKGFERTANGRIVERYKADDSKLIRFWWLDDDTELLPSPDTEFKAMCAPAGILYWSDFFAQNYFERGGIKPTLIAMKGLLIGDKKEDFEKSWSEWVRGIGKRVGAWLSARMYNAESMDIQPFGEGLGDLKETPVFRQALENIAIAKGMPLSVLLSNAATYATAQVDRSMWYQNDIIPRHEFICDTLTEQFWMPQFGLRMESRPEASQPEQEEEVARSDALIRFGEALEKYPTYDLLVSAAVGVFGYELPDDFLTAAEAYYKDKEKKAEEVQAQMQEQPAEVVPPKEEPEEMMKWIPSLDEFDELRIWREVAERKHKKGESLDFAYEPHKVPLPAPVMQSIKAKLLTATTPDAIKAAFDLTISQTPAPAYDPGIVTLAESLNKLAESLNNTKQLPATT